MADSIGIALLAAGKGTRLNIETAKPLLPILGLKMVDFVVDSINEFTSKVNIDGHFGVVVGHQKELVEEHLKKYSKMNFAWQKEQKGTADALRSYFAETPKSWDKDFTLIICADTPLITAENLIQLWNEIQKDKNCQAVCATFKAIDPTGYGRIIRAGSGFEIKEHKDASEEIRKIDEVNSGLYLIRTSYIKKYLNSINSNNASGEFYLTDLFKTNENVKPILFKDAINFEGVNTLEQWHLVKKQLQQRKLVQLMKSGVMIYNLENTHIDWNVKIAKQTEIHSGCTILGNTEIEQDVVIEDNCWIKNSKIYKAAIIHGMSHLEEAIVHSQAGVGPMARLRPGSEIGKKAKIGNFVEVKKSKLAEGVKVSHLSYVGDAEIGKDSNIGCGFITCNYDGANKHKTIIGEGTFIGSDVQAIAPITIGNNAFVAAGSTITDNMEDGAFAIARQKQVTKPDMAKRFLKKK